MQITITKISRFTEDQQGNPLKTKDGRPYERVRLQTQEHGSDWISGFGNLDNKEWKEGDTIELDVKQVGQYLNFTMPKKTNDVQIEWLKNEIERLRKQIDEHIKNHGK